MNTPNCINLCAILDGADDDDDQTNAAYAELNKLCDTIKAQQEEIESLKMLLAESFRERDTLNY